MLEAEMDASNERDIEDLNQEIERLKVKHAIYRQSPELSEIAAGVAENIGHLNKLLIQKGKIFRLARPADNITATQSVKPKDLSAALEAAWPKEDE